MIALYVRVVVLSALITGSATSSSPQANVEQLPIQAPCQMPPLYGQDMAEQGAEGSGSLDLLTMDEREAAHRLGLLNKIGAFLNVQTLVAAADRGTGEDEVILLRIRQQLSDQLLIASVDIAAFTGFMDCEAVRASHLAAILESGGAERQRTRTIFGILGDTLIGITAGIFSLGDLSTAAAVASIRISICFFFETHQDSDNGRWTDRFTSLDWFFQRTSRYP